MNEDADEERNEEEVDGQLVVRVRNETRCTRMSPNHPDLLTGDE